MSQKDLDNGNRELSNAIEDWRVNSDGNDDSTKEEIMMDDLKTLRKIRKRVKRLITILQKELASIGRCSGCGSIGDPFHYGDRRI